NGRHASYLESKGYRVVCADISWGMLMVAKKRVRDLVQCDASALPFRDSSFGTVLFLATIHHLPKEDRLRSLEEIRRVLKPGGRLIVSAWALFQPRFFGKIPWMLLNPLRGREFGDLTVPWHRKGRVYQRYYHLFTRSELESLVEEAGLKTVRSYGRSFKYRWFAENHVVVAEKV
ncbi:MAG: methyltransferase domain-containing protein, partial [Candidatus Korarchaeota archaeon]|nr:methyltransferase domain-containing protein [Candidatus Korarchaeota archaeon]